MDSTRKVRWECTDCGDIVNEIPEKQSSTDTSERYVLGKCKCRKANANPRYATFKRIEP